MLRKWISMSFLILLIYLPGYATVIHVPDNQPTIQAGIDNASDGDTVCVAHGVYYENISFRNRGIVVTSNYLFDSSIAHIDSTIINGSTPSHPDTASCVLIVSDSTNTAADTSAALIGFTVTGGTGTKWADEHGAGTFREAGAILIQYLSPRIMHNVIAYNEALNTQGVTSAGGGAIRCGDGNPRILNNVIVRNSAHYGGGIVLNYTGAIVRNNVIAYDSCTNAYGGGAGIWCYGSGSYPKIIENNTIAYNKTSSSSLLAGGIYVAATSCSLKNNIIWGNANRQIRGSAVVTYCDVEGGWTGDGNIDANPLFSPEDFYLSDTSPCVDAGDPDQNYDDIEDPNNPGYALWPSMGELRNDMGAYGGPGTAVFGTVLVISEHQEHEINVGTPVLRSHPNPFSTETYIKLSTPQSALTARITIYDATGRVVRSFEHTQPEACVWHGDDDTGQLVNPGVYICRVQAGDAVLTAKMVKYE